MSDAAELTVRAASPYDPQARTLLLALDAELSRDYPDPADQHGYVGVPEIAAGEGVFLLAHRGDTPIGCGGLRFLDTATGEIKRMYVAPEGRGTGVGRRLLTELERHARSRGLTRLVLETGDRLTDAVRLYSRAGFTPIPRYGPYVDARASRCLAKPLDGFGTVTP